MAAGSAVRIVGLGAGGLGGASSRAEAVLRQARKVFVRTEHHPAVAELSDRGIHFESFDALYEAAETFDEVYQRIADRVLAESARGEVVYATPGHPLVGERSVALIIEGAAKLGVTVSVEPSSSFIEAVLETLMTNLDSGLKILDALQIEDLTPSLDTPNIIYQVYDRDTASRVKLRLMEFFPEDFEALIISAAGTENARILRVPLYELDRREVDHLTVVYVPEMARKAE